MSWLSDLGLGVQGNIVDWQHRDDLTQADALDADALAQAQAGLKNLDPNSIQVGNVERVDPRLQGASEFNKFSADPALVQAQRAALAQIQAEGSQSGLGIEDRIALAQAKAQGGAADRGQRQAILAAMQARGGGGEGAALAAQLSNQQASAQNGAVASQSAALAARQRQLQAMQEAGQLGGAMRGQDFSENAARARAQDTINQFNTGAQNNAAAANAQAENMRRFYNAQAAYNAASYNRQNNMDRYGLGRDAAAQARARHDRAVQQATARSQASSAPFDKMSGDVMSAFGMATGASNSGGGGGGGGNASGGYGSGYDLNGNGVRDPNHQQDQGGMSNYDYGY